MGDEARLLLDLVLDADDTFVTRVTTEALLRRHDSVGLDVVASALATADPNHTDWIHRAVVDVFVVYSRDRDAAARDCEVKREVGSSPGAYRRAAAPR